jgi:biofilm PGA synthesis N-glycosyltransferase PgaC
VTTWILALFVVGVNFAFWGTMGLFRLIDEQVMRARAARRRRRARAQLSPAGTQRPPAGEQRRDWLVYKVAVLMAAHNEELVIESSLRALAKLVSLQHVYVISDASTDRTLEIAHEVGAHVAQTKTNLGKAGALRAGIRHFKLLDSYEAVMVLDADTRLDQRYFRVALPLFDDPKVVAVAGCAHTRTWRRLGPLGSFIVAYRQRIYVLTQLLLKYGQTWRGVNATHIVPGFASIYRTRALRYIDINPRGIVIEDFNMTFELYAKRLGRVAFHPGARAYTQDPIHLHDYIRQTKRWALGLWQTVRRHKLHRNGFSLMLFFLLGELVTASIMYLLLIPVVLLLAIPDLIHPLTTWPVLGTVHAELAAHLSLTVIALGVLLPDYLLSCLVALIERKARYLILGLLFVPMKIVDAGIALYSLPRAWLERSSGQWVSPARRAETPVESKGVA